MHNAPSSGDVYATLAVTVLALTLLSFILRGLRGMFLGFRRANHLMDRLQALLEQWEGHPATATTPEQPPMPVRVTELETAVRALQTAHPRPRRGVT